MQDDSVINLFVKGVSLKGNDPLVFSDRTLMHNTFDGTCLKGYLFYFKLGQFSTVRREEAVQFDVQQRVCISFKFCFLSVTVTDNMDKSRLCMAYITKTDAEAQWTDLQSAMSLASTRAIQSAQLHLLVTLC